MSIKRVAGRYAKSLIGLSIERNELETVLSDMKSLIQMTANKDLDNMLKSPIIGIDKKRAVFKELFDTRFSELSGKFINLVLTKGREPILTAIAKEFIEQYNEFNGITQVQVTSATPLHEAALKNITDKLLQSNLGLKNIQLKTKVDSNIIGGIIIQIGDKLIDDSVAYKLKILGKNFDGKEYIKAI